MDDLFICDEWNLEVNLVNDDGTPLDLTDKTVLFMLAADINCKPQIQQEFINDVDPETGIARIKIEESETSSLSSGLNWICFLLEGVDSELTIFQERVQLKTRLQKG